MSHILSEKILYYCNSRYRSRALALREETPDYNYRANLFYCTIAKEQNVNVPCQCTTSESIVCMSIEQFMGSKKGGGCFGAPKIPLVSNPQKRLAHRAPFGGSSPASMTGAFWARFSR